MGLYNVGTLVTPFDRANARIGGAASAIEYILGDGTPFFDAMDDWLCAREWYALQLDRFIDRLSDSDIVVSGEWGRRFSQWYDEQYGSQPDVPYVLVLPGGLRHGELPPLGMNLLKRRFIFLDNSCYKGRTRNKIKQGIEDAGGRLVTSLVLYDGSIDPIEGISGIFRYHGGR